ncbi:TRAP transporter large permease [Pontivivens nitratireducens]|uniref:TRAP transporter large permease protein n=1 Tax=Pontivivens nitratireducens TaxID=2758038 RepID=A0A6G7VJF1_9RHOB|nr:TRAP transporter large permease [Pontibrevibacter nitratireducens]QIK39996.1 TRAP transporter large permease [Pontibrevibacter nitratireducens]
MSGVELAILGFVAMLGMIAIRIPIAAAMAITGFVGVWILRGSPDPMMNLLKSVTWDAFASYSLSIVPLFLLMGQFASKSGMSERLFRATADWLGHRPGGIAIAAVGACAGFGAVSGSSLATASTMGQVALPEMKRYGYSDALATGVLAAGGTLGILIPPSIILVIYAILTEQNIEKMFAAAILPGLLAVAGYILVVMIYVALRPDAAQRMPRQPWAVRRSSLVRVWPVVAVFVLVIGGIAADWNWLKPGRQALFTPIEGAAVGAVLTGLYGLLTGGLDRRSFTASILEAAQATGMIYLILFGAQVFNTFLAFTRTPQALADWVVTAGFSPMVVLLLMLATYLIFGCVMDSLSMILLTIPIFFPIVQSLEFGLTPDETAIWFGILVLIVVEVGLITPPVGMNLFIINALAREVPIRRTYAGVMPFVISDLIRVAVLIASPWLSLVLVRAM